MYLFFFKQTVEEDNRATTFCISQSLGWEGLQAPALNRASSTSCYLEPRPCWRGERTKDTVKFVLIMLGGHAVQVLLVTVKSPGVGARSFWLVSICVFQKGICAVLKVCPQ